MANDTSCSVWSIDTASTTSIDATKSGVLAGVRWVGATTAGHKASIFDHRDRLLWTSVASAANYVEADAPFIPFVGLKVSTLDSGKLYLNFA